MQVAFTTGVKHISRACDEARAKGHEDLGVRLVLDDPYFDHRLELIEERRERSPSWPELGGGTRSGLACQATNPR